MLGILVAMQYLLLTPMLVRIWEDVQEGKDNSLSISFLFFLLLIVVLRGIRVNRRREILEEELLSINSCAKVWHAVALCHLEAMSEGSGNYLTHLSQAAGSIDFSQIPEWIANHYAAKLPPF